MVSSTQSTSKQTQKTMGYGSQVKVNDVDHKTFLSGRLDLGSFIERKDVWLRNLAAKTMDWVGWFHIAPWFKQLFAYEKKVTSSQFAEFSRSLQSDFSPWYHWLRFENREKQTAVFLKVNLLHTSNKIPHVIAM